MKKTILISLFCISIALLKSQTHCPNIDFSQGDFSGWTPTTGPGNTCCSNPGIINPSNFTIISTPGPDFNTCQNVPRIPTGLTQVARVGSTGGGGYGNYTGKKLKYDLTVDAGHSLLIYELAAIYFGTGVSGTHYNTSGAHIKGKLLDTNGQPIGNGNCGDYNVYDGITSYTAQCGFAGWLPWSAVAVDLTAYIGQTVSLEFYAYDCWTGDHGSYAYVAASCNKFVDTVWFCPELTEFSFSAPPRFHSYSWSNGNTTQTVTVQNPYDGQAVTCALGGFNGCSAVKTYILKAYDAATADFTVQNPGTSACSAVDFSDNSSISGTASIIVRQWNFDDPASGNADTSSLLNPAHVFSSAGSYNVSLVVVSSQGCKDTITKPVTVLSASGYITAGFSSASGANACSEIAFTNSIAIQNGAATGTWHWDFGDPASGAANTSNQQNPVHVFSSLGTFDVTLIASTANGCADTVSQQVTVQSVGGAVFFTDENICMGDTSFFIDASVGNISLYEWDFGDNSPVNNNANPVHVYAGEGTYTVSLHITTQSGCQATATQQVAVAPSPNASFTANPQRFCAPDTLHFSANAQSAVTCQWNFGDNSPEETGNAATHLYSNAGNYIVSLTATDNNGCSAQSTQTIEVLQGIDATILVIEKSKCVNDSVYFENVSVGFTTGSVVWDFGDGSPQRSGASVMYLYQLAGTYTVTVHVVSADGCEAQATVSVTRAPLPEPEIYTNGNELATGTYAAYQWYINGQTIGGANSQTLTAAESGTYTVAVTDSNNCKGTSQPEQVTVSGINEQAFAQAFTVYPNPASTQLTITFSIPTVFTATVQGIEGKTLQQAKGENQLTIGINELPPAIYLLKITTGDGWVITKKIVKE